MNYGLEQGFLWGTPRKMGCSCGIPVLLLTFSASEDSQAARRAAEVGRSLGICLPQEWLWLCAWSVLRLSALAAEWSQPQLTEPFLTSACCLPSISTHMFGVPAALDEVVPFCRNPLYPLLCKLCTLCFNVKLALSPAISLAICAWLLTAWKNLNADLYLLMIELFMALWRSACCFWSWRELTEKTGTSCLPFWNLKHESFFSFNVSLEVIFKSYRKALIVQHTSWKGFLRISVILRSCVWGGLFFFSFRKTLSNAVFKLMVSCDEVQNTENELPSSSHQKLTGFASDHTCFLQVREIRPKGKSEQK